MTESWVWSERDGGPRPFEKGGGAARTRIDGHRFVVAGTARTYHSRLFNLQAHLKQFEYRLLEIGMEPPPAGKLAHVVEALSGKRAPLESRVDFLLERQPADGPRGPVGGWAAAASPLSPHVSAYYERGVRCDVKVVDEREPLDFLRVREFSLGPDEQDGWAFESVLVGRDGVVLGCGSSALFAVMGKTVKLPEGPACNVERVAGRVVAGLCGAKGLAVLAQKTYLEQLSRAEEIFLVSALREVVPVIELGGKAVGRGEPGPITDGLLGAYQALCLRETT